VELSRKWSDKAHLFPKGPGPEARQTGELRFSGITGLKPRPPGTDEELLPSDVYHPQILDNITSQFEAPDSYIRHTFRDLLGSAIKGHRTGFISIGIGTIVFTIGLLEFGARHGEDIRPLKEFAERFFAHEEAKKRKKPER
jgi:hypothetical protein